MKTDDKNYPHEGMESLDILPLSNRLAFVENAEGSNNELAKTILLGYATALRAAEEQIESLQRRLPFTPESFGFKFVEGKTDLYPPHYLSKNGEVIISNGLVKPLSWLIGEGKFGNNTTEVTFVHKGIAEAYFAAVGYEWDKNTEIKVSFTEEDEKKILEEHDNAQVEYREIKAQLVADVEEHNKIVDEVISETDDAAKQEGYVIPTVEEYEKSKQIEEENNSLDTKL